VESIVALVPFTPEQIKKAKSCQQMKLPDGAPYSCKNGCGLLIIEENGMRCKKCDYTQDWMWDITNMADLHASLNPLCITSNSICRMCGGSEKLISFSRINFIQNGERSEEIYIWDGCLCEKCEGVAIIKQARQNAGLGMHDFHNPGYMERIRKEQMEWIAAGSPKISTEDWLLEVKRAIGE
jgi:hypothetical protein